MSTKVSLAQQIIYKLYGRDGKPSDPVQLPDVILSVGQEANYILKGQYFEVMSRGERMPENLAIFEYPKQPLTTYGGKKSRCKLPAIPIGLPRNQGVWQVSTDEFFNCTGIPIGAGQGDLLKVQDMISDIMGQWAYEVQGAYVITNKDLTIDGTDGLYFRLIGTDINALLDYDPLPLPADMEATLIDGVYKSFLPVEQQPRVVDNYSATTQPAKQ